MFTRKLCDLRTHECDAECHFYVYECDLDSLSVIITGTNVIFRGRVRYTHVQYDFNTHECDVYTQNVISKFMSVIFIQKSMNMTRTNVISSGRVQYSHAECDFNTHECDVHVHECDFDELKCEDA
jgi:hypothetical protein